MNVGVFSHIGSGYNDPFFEVGLHIMADHAPSQSKVPGWVWLFTGTILGAFIMFLMRLSELQPHMPNTRQTRIDPVPSQAQEHKETRFDFYKLLKDTEVPITAKPNTQQQKIDSNTEYLLQVASFRAIDDAEQVRAELLLLNLNARVESAKVDSGSTWHRVIVGPYATRSQMAKAKSTLLSNRYEAMLLKRKRS